MSRRTKRIILWVGTLLLFAWTAYSATPVEYVQTEPIPGSPANVAFETLEVKGRAPKSGYERDKFGDGWDEVNGCDVRNVILYRDLTNVRVGDDCLIQDGTLDDPYTGKTIQFMRTNASAVQIDHVVALSDAWQKGAQQLDTQTRVRFSNDPLNLLAVDGPANQQKGDGDAATWLPSNTTFRCEYIARQVAVKQKYQLWVTEAEKDAMQRVLLVCPQQILPMP